MENVIDSLSFKNYRNLEETTMEFNPGINIIYGNNGMGKTNILETIFLCSTGRSHRTHKISNLINFERQSAGIVLYKKSGKYTDKINISLKEGEKKGISVNGIALRKTSELFGNLKVVMFSPEDMGLINGGPNLRRRFMDMELCQLSKIYCHNLEQYFKVLKQRNNLLKNGGNIRETLFVWDRQLAEYGCKIIASRKEFMEKTAPVCNDYYSRLTEGRENIEISYKPESSEGDFADRLKKSLERDIYYKNTNNGPHRDDITFKINGSEIRAFGSQGQKKSAALALKLSEVEILKKETGNMPVLLLDDVLSELDRGRQEFILNSLKNMQIILTCTGMDSFIENMRKNEKTKVFFVNYGKITVKI
ncbi:MAG: DNA replication/repair protein RecF [Clostridiales bacterium]|nr:DNA replication/repair protein RecF [Clostridiales bacterium]